MPEQFDLKTIRREARNLSFQTQAFIGGKFKEALSGDTFPTENPATGEILAHVASCDEEDVAQATQVARNAFEFGRWSKCSPGERKNVLLRLADAIESHQFELALLDSVEAGKPISDCLNIDVPETLACLRWYAEAIDKLYDQVAPTSLDNLGLIVHEPIGVVGAVVPWNFPLLMAAWKVAPALAAGNSVILKPSELTSLSALLLAKLAAEAGIPDGVFNVVPGFGETAGQAIGRHPDVDCVAFTGSTEVGRLFLQYSADSNLKRITLECGGKSPQVVLADASNLDAVADHVVNAAFWNMGENCSCGSRLIVDRSIKDKLLEKVVKKTRDWSVGSPLDPQTKVGALIEHQHLEKVISYIDAGREAGAQLVTGGARILKDTGGYFVQPTVFDAVRPDMTIATEEIFGPVLSVISAESDEDAVRLANESNYGLAASLYTQDVNKAHQMSRALRAGTVSVNCYSEGDITTPFGGYKSSGFGGRDNSLQAFEQYTETKTIWFDLGCKEYS